MIPLGSRVRDSITGYTGIAIGRTEWLHGCARIGIEREVLDKDKKPIPAEWFDEQRVVVVKELKTFVSPQNSATSGGPQRDQTRNLVAPRAR